MRQKRVLLYTILSAVLAGPLGGFIFGIFNCKDCGYNILARLFIGCIMAVLTPLSGGFPARNEGGVGGPYNAWPAIALAFIAILSVLLWRERKGGAPGERVPRRDKGDGLS